VVPSSLVTPAVLAVVSSADLIWPGVQVGCSAATSAAEPAACGDDIEVPAIAWNRLPGGPRPGASGVGVLPARIWRPGAVMSGLIQSAPGPRDEKKVTRSPCQVVLMPCGKEPVVPGCAVRKSSSCWLSGWLMWTVGSQWLSVMTSSGVALYRIMPAAPPLKTLKPRWTRPGPRWQATILPVNVPGAAGAAQPTLE